MTSGSASFFILADIPQKLPSAIVDGLESRQRTIGSAWSSDETALESRLGSCPI
jgi:hypothetical protein